MTESGRRWVIMRVVQSVLRYPRLISVPLHLALIVISSYVAFLLRFDGLIPPSQFARYVDTLGWLLIVRGLTFIPFRLYSGLWRYTSTADVVNIVAACGISSAAFLALTYMGLVDPGYPRSVLVIDTIALVVFMSGIRLARRISREIGRLEGRRRVLIYGAGDAGVMIVREMHHDPSHEYEPVGFLDDNPAKVGLRIHGVRVLGGRPQLARILEQVKPDVMLIAMPRVAPATVREIVKALTPFKVPIQTLPSLPDLLGAPRIGQIRNLEVDDLLERPQVDLMAHEVRHLIEGKRLLVTGAGGSIGSELCRQIAALRPELLVMVDRYENGLYAINNELASCLGPAAVKAVVGDVTDVSRVDSILATYEPHIVFHAAAHKHVPLMEWNPAEAVKNNVRGTRVVAEASAQHGVDRFILISTDKAVNPSSVMGATKRVAELIVLTANPGGGCIFTAVRFGNVLGSNGSVVPLFLDQIKAGGPVTVTHTDVRRYFMLIPEAVALVLRAATLAKGGDIFVLEMGEQIRVLDMARNMIRLAGFVPEREIPIQIVGLRPGEKLLEELVGTDEVAFASGVPGIQQLAQIMSTDGEKLAVSVSELERHAETSDCAAVITKLTDIVPVFHRAYGATNGHAETAALGDGNPALNA